MRGLALGCLVWAALAACGGLADDDTAAVVGRVKEGMEAQAAGVQAMSTQSAAAAATQASGAPPPAVKGASGLMPDQVGRAARDEVARSLGVPPEQVSLEKVEPVQWTDASLGCAEAGRTYAQAVAPGFRVLLTAAGQPRHVHADAAGRMVVCARPTQ
jgi:hypothetical protein